jgi:hypothetical protein
MMKAVMALKAHPRPTTSLYDPNGKDPKMTIQVKQPLPNSTRQAYLRDEAQPRQRNRSAPMDFDAGYALVSSLIIWGSFILTFWSFI